MASHLIPRVLQSIAVVFVVVSLVFVGSRLIGDPIEAYSARNATQEAIDAARDRLGLLDPMIVQYGNFLWGVLRLDFGDSIFSEQPAWDEVSSRLWATVQLSLAAFVLILAIGVPIGVLAALRRGSIPDLIARLLAAGRSGDAELLARSAADLRLRGATRLVADQRTGRVREPDHARDHAGGIRRGGGECG